MAMVSHFMSLAGAGWAGKVKYSWPSVSLGDLLSVNARILMPKSLIQNGLVQTTLSILRCNHSSMEFRFCITAIQGSEFQFAGWGRANMSLVMLAGENFLTRGIFSSGLPL